MTPENFERVPGSVWTRRIYDLLPDVHDCRAHCDGESKAMRWRPPVATDKPHTWFRPDTFCGWMGKYPQIPLLEHDFSLGPEYPGSLPTS